MYVCNNKKIPIVELGRTLPIELLAIKKGWLETGLALMDSQMGAIREERIAANNLKIRA